MSDLENRYWQEPGVHTELDLRVLAKRAEHKAGEGGTVDGGPSPRIQDVTVWEGPQIMMLAGC